MRNMGRILIFSVIFLSLLEGWAQAGNLKFIDSDQQVQRGARQNMDRLVISEVMASSQNPVQDEDGDSVSWIELYNGSSSAINLDGYSIANDDADWRFPEVRIAPRSYLLIYASRKNRTEASLHTNFQVSDKGDKITLRDAVGSVIDEAFIGEMQRGFSRGIQDGVYLLMEPTPGRANEMQSAPAKIVINEVMTNNTSTLADLDGQYHGWVELHNSGNLAVDLGGFSFIYGEHKWTFPELEIASGAFQTVFISGKKDVSSATGEYHADFQFRKETGILKLTDGSGRMVDQMVLRDMPENVSRGRLNVKPWTVVYFEEATPGQDNASVGSARRLGIQQTVKN